MIFRQICKDSCAESNLVGAVEYQRVGGNLHNDVCTARIAHVGEKLLQLEVIGAVRSVCDQC